MPRNSHLAWTVKYAPGTLLAKGYKGGQVVAEDKVETTGAPAAVKLTPDRATIHADGEDSRIITVAVDGRQGPLVPVGGQSGRLRVSGPGRIIGVGNGDPSCHEPDVYITGQWQRSVFNGLAEVIVQAAEEPGTIALTARADGLDSTPLNITANAAVPRPAVP